MDAGLDSMLTNHNMIVVADFDVVLHVQSWLLSGVQNHPLTSSTLAVAVDVQAPAELVRVNRGRGSDLDRVDGRQLCGCTQPRQRNDVDVDGCI